MIKEFQDQIGRTLELKDTPRRIVCLVPSLTELLFDLGLGKLLKGRTKFCIHPEDKIKKVSVIGGTKKIHLDRIESLKPDFILANKEENLQDDINYLEKITSVYVSNIKNTKDTLELINDLSNIFDCSQEARLVNQKLNKVILEIETRTPQIPIRALYLIWQNPYMAAGTDTYISSVMSLCGLENVLVGWGTKGLRYPELNPELIRSLEPEVLLLSSEPFPFKEFHAKRIQGELDIPAVCVDGEFFSWYGTRMIYAVDGISPLLNTL